MRSLIRCAGVFGVAWLICAATPGWAEVLRVTELTAPQLRTLDRSTTLVVLTGGMIEEHGPYLPTSTDAILSERLTDDVAHAVIAKKPGWTVLLFPPIPFGASGSNEIGGHFTFPGTYAVRPSTLRAVLMDLASELGEQGFRWIMVVHVHGSPLHLRAIDDAGDFFHDTYGGWMINLWDLVPVISGWGHAMAAAMTDAEKKEDGASLHGGTDEHSLLLYLKPGLVAPGYRNAPIVTGGSAAESFAAARRADWPGYLGSPRLATAALGEQIWKGFAAAATDQTLKILDGADASKIPRYVDLLEKNPLYQREWIKPSTAHDEALGRKQGEWISRRIK
jgi:creatinine amidohydrolase/Fe(II)-dependent formamide hydrolase-like protein